MSKFGWCFGPEGAIGDHGSCPGELGADGMILRCGCPCHEGASDRTFPLQAWENGTSTEDGPGVGALTPTESQGLDPHHLSERKC